MLCHLPTAQRSSAQCQLKQMGGRTHLNWFHIIRFSSYSRKQSLSSRCLSETRLLSTETKLRRAEVDNNLWLSANVAPIFLISCHLKLLTSVCCLVCHLRRLRREDTEVYKTHFIFLPYESQKADVTVFSPQRAAHIYRKFPPSLKKKNKKTLYDIFKANNHPGSN